MRWALILLLLASPAMARDFYLDPAGGTDMGAACDAGECTVGTPCLNFDKIKDLCPLSTDGPHSIIVVAGDYDETDFNVETVNFTSDNGCGNDSGFNFLCDWDHATACSPDNSSNEPECNYRSSEWPGVTATFDGGPLSFLMLLDAPCDGICTLRCATSAGVTDADQLRTDARTEACTLSLSPAGWAQYHDELIAIGVHSDDWVIDGFGIHVPFGGIWGSSVSDLTIKNSDIEFNVWDCGNGIKFKNITDSCGGGSAGCINDGGTIDGNSAETSNGDFAVVIKDTSIRPWNNDPWVNIQAWASSTASTTRCQSPPSAVSTIFSENVDGIAFERVWIQGGYQWMEFGGKQNEEAWHGDASFYQSHVEGAVQHGWRILKVRDTGDIDPVCGDASACFSSSIIKTGTGRGRCFNHDADGPGPGQDNGLWPEDTFVEFSMCSGATQAAADAECAQYDNAGNNWANKCRRFDSICRRNNANYSCTNGTDCVWESAATPKSASGLGICGSAIGAHTNGSQSQTNQTGDTDPGCGNEVANRCDFNHMVYCPTLAASSAWCTTNVASDGDTYQLTVRGSRLLELASNLGPVVIAGSTISGYGSAGGSLVHRDNRVSSDRTSGCGANDSACRYCLYNTSDGTDNSAHWGTALAAGSTGQCWDGASGTDAQNPLGLCNAAPNGHSRGTCAAGATCDARCYVDGLVYANNAVLDWHGGSQGSGNGDWDSYFLQYVTDRDMYVSDDFLIDFSVVSIGAANGENPLALEADDYGTQTAVEDGNDPANIRRPFWTDNASTQFEVLCDSNGDKYHETTSSTTCYYGESPDPCGTAQCPDSGGFGNSGAVKGQQWYDVRQCEGTGYDFTETANTITGGTSYTCTASTCDNGPLAGKACSDAQDCNGCFAEPDLTSAFTKYWGGDLSLASASSVLVDAGSGLNAQWCPNNGTDCVNLCPAVDYYGNARTGLCDVGAAEWIGAVETNCTDTIDNDSDGDTDCADSDCAAHPSCLPAGDLPPGTSGGSWADGSLQGPL